MKNFYTVLLTVVIAGAFSFTNDPTIELYEDCFQEAEFVGPGVIYPGNSLYAVTFGPGDNFGRFSYYPESDVIAYDVSASHALTETIPYGTGYRSINGLFYAILSDLPGGTRNMYTVNHVSGVTTLLGAVVSSTGATNPSAMTIGPNGVAYITYGSGEINTLDLDTGIPTALGTLPAAGGAGLTYDFDNDRLIFAAGTGPVELYEIDPLTGVSNFLFSDSVPGAIVPCTGQAIEYVGNGKLISSSTFDCGIIYTIDLLGGVFSSLVNPNPFNLSVKDFVYINNSTPYGVTCNDATVEVQSDLSIPFNGGTLSDATNNLYAMDLNLTTGIDDVHLYNYDPTNDDISVKTAVVTSTGPDQFYAMDWHPIENQVYILQDNVGGRSLHSFDLSTGVATLIAPMVSFLGDTQPQDMTFGYDGALYVTFQSGEIGIYDFATAMMLPFADVGAAGTGGGVGLTYDFDNNRLLHASGTGSITLNGIDIATTAVSVVTTFIVPDGGCGGTSQGIEYVGGDKAVSSTTFGCDTIYTIELIGGAVAAIRNPSVDDGFDVRIKDLMYIGMTATLSPSSFDCGDIGANSVTVDVVDYAGNVSSCSATLTITDPNDFCGLSVDEFDDNQFVLFPNPAGDFFQVQWHANEPLIGIQVFDILGKAVLTFDSIQAENPVIDVAGLSAGIYVVKFQTELGSTTARLVKQ